jgi:hypothetical protein
MQAPVLLKATAQAVDSLGVSHLCSVCGFGKETFEPRDLLRKIANAPEWKVESLVAGEDKVCNVSPIVSAQRPASFKPKKSKGNLKA